MHIFNEEKAVVALFDDEKQLDRALKALEDRKHEDDDLIVLDRARLAQTNPAVSEAQGARAGAA